MALAKLRSAADYLQIYLRYACKMYLLGMMRAVTKHRSAAAYLAYTWKMASNWTQEDGFGHI